MLQSRMTCPCVAQDRHPAPVHRLDNVVNPSSSCGCVLWVLDDRHIPCHTHRCNSRPHFDCRNGCSLHLPEPGNHIGHLLEMRRDDCRNNCLGEIAADSQDGSCSAYSRLPSLLGTWICADIHHRSLLQSFEWYRAGVPSGFWSGSTYRGPQ